MSGQPHVPTNLLSVPAVQEAGWVLEPVWARWRREKIPPLPLPAIEPRSLTCRNTKRVPSADNLAPPEASVTCRVVRGNNMAGVPDILLFGQPHATVLLRPVC